MLKFQVGNELERWIWMCEYVIVQNHFLGSYFRTLCGGTLSNVSLLEQWCYSKDSLLLQHTVRSFLPSTWTKQHRAILPPLKVHWDKWQKLQSISIQMNFSGDIQCTKGGVTKESCLGSGGDSTTFPWTKLWPLSLNAFILDWVYFRLTLILNLTAWNSLFWLASSKLLGLHAHP